MAEQLPPGTPEVDDPLLVADLIRLLSIKGAIGRLPLADIVLPVVSLGDVVQPTVQIRSPAFRSTDVFSEGSQSAPISGTILADTGALQAGTYDVMVQHTQSGGGSQGTTALEHRNAANTATLMEVAYATSPAATGTLGMPVLFSFGYELSLNERLRIVTGTAGGTGTFWVGIIWARLRV